MADVMAPSEGPAAAVQVPAAVLGDFRIKLQFVQRLLASAQTVEQYVAAAECASRLADSVSNAAQGKVPVVQLSQPAARPAINTRAPQCTLTLHGLPVAPTWDWMKCRNWLRNDLKLRVAHVEKWPEATWALVRFVSPDDTQAARRSLQAASLPQGCDPAGITLEEGEPAAIAEARAAKQAATGKLGRKRKSDTEQQPDADPQQQKPRQE